MPFSSSELPLERLDERRLSLDRSVLMVPGVRTETRDRLSDFWRRRVGDDSLAERDRPRCLGHPPADHRNDGRLDGCQATGLGETSHGRVRPLSAGSRRRVQTRVT